jgi:hypothetical protein
MSISNNLPASAILKTNEKSTQEDVMKHPKLLILSLIMAGLLFNSAFAAPETQASSKIKISQGWNFNAPGLPEDAAQPSKAVPVQPAPAPAKKKET